ncbi:hypothetical protein KDK88_09285, partial [bacterium]|nr:hypothetical protein [bacterium]
LAGLLDTPDGGGLDDESIVMLGTIRYMSPEQLHAGSGAVDARADVFALGILGYELLTGAHPFGRAEDPAPRILASILMDEPPSTDLSTDLDQVLRRAMAKQPGERYADAAALGEDLERCRGGGRTEAWTRRRVRTGWKAAKAVGLVAVLAALVFGIAKLLAPDPYLTEQEVVAEIYGHLEKMEDSIHRGVRSETSLTSALEEGMEATRLLSYLGNRPASVSINRYICYRMGEAHLFLGWLKDDFQHFRAAFERFSSGVYRSTYGQNVAGLDTTLAIVKRIRDLAPGVCSGSRAFALSEMAEFGDTRDRRLRALLFRDDAMRRWCEYKGHPRRPYEVERPDPFPFHDLGRAAIYFGRETDDVVLVLLGMYALEHVAADELWTVEKRLGHAAYQESYAVGLAALAELLDAPLGLDRILARLDQAQAIRGVESPHARSQTRLIRADILLNWNDRFGRREDLLQDARENAALAMQYLADHGGGRREAQARVLLARLDLRLANDETAARAIAAELEPVRGTPDFDALPVLHAHWLLARAELGHAFPSVHPDWRQD